MPNPESPCAALVLDESLPQPLPFNSVPSDSIRNNNVMQQLVYIIVPISFLPINVHILINDHLYKL